MGRLDRLRSVWIEVALATGCTLLALWVYRSVRGAYFSPDDLMLLERTSGLAPRLNTAWRYLSGQAYFDLVTPWFKTDPRPYMLVNWLLHGVCVALLYAWARRHGDRLAAVLAAGLFGASRLFFSVVSQVVGVGEMLALAFVLAASLAVSAQRPRFRWLALPLFLAALLSKESVALIPAALLLSPAVGATIGARAKRLAPLLATSLALVLYLMWTGVQKTVFAGRPYETGFGANLIVAIIQYAGWSVNVEDLTPDFYGAKAPVPWATGLGLMLLCATGAWFARRRTMAPAVGLAWWTLGLAPVLPLLWQRYLNYLYSPFAGLALAIGGIAALPFRRDPQEVDQRRPPLRASKGKTPRRPASSRRLSAALAWGAALVVLVSYARWSESLLHAREAGRLGYVDIPLDPVVRKMELTRRVAARVNAALVNRHASMVFYIPEIGEHNLFFSDLLRNVLDQGRGLRAVCPNLDSVAFVSHWTPAYRDFDLVAGSVDGLVDVLGVGPDAHLALATKLMRFRLPQEAAEHLQAAAVAYPQDARLPLARAAVVLRLGQRAEAAANCREAIARAPGSAYADSAQAMLRRLDAG